VIGVKGGKTEKKKETNIYNVEKAGKMITQYSV
jgi:hypothetical protein